MHGKTIANLPRGMEMEAATLEEAVQLLAEKGKELPPMKGKGGARGKAKAAPKRAAAADGAAPKPAAKKAAPKAAAKKAPAKKPVAKKAAAKKPAAAKAR
jgi:DNA topoisomerase-1